MTRAPIPTRVAALAALIALGLVAAWFLRGGGMSPGSVPAGGGAGKQAQVSKGGSPGGPPGGVPVETMTAEQAPLAETVRAVGTLRSNESVMLRPEIAGRVLETLFTEGQLVAEGALLIRLDDAVAEAELAAAEAAAVLSRQNYARARELLTKGAGTARARDEALARMQMDKAQVELMRARLSKTRLIAPFAGIVGLRKVSVGDYVAPGQDIVNLESVDALKLDFRIPERHLGALAVGQKIIAELDAFSGKTFEGEVYAIDPLIDVAGRSIAVRANLPNPGRALRPGLFARVTLVVEERARAVVVPEQAIVPQGGNFFVFKVADGKAALVPVEIGRRAAGRVEIVKGVHPGESVVVAGQIKIRDGVPVRPIAPSPAPSAPKPGN